MRTIDPSLVLAGLLLLFVGCARQPTRGPQAPPEVPVAQVTVQDVPVYVEAVGETAGILDINIRARVDGTLEKVHFREGEKVQKGDLLYSIDQAPLLAELREAEGKLAEAKARLVRAESNLRRVKPLVQIDALSQRTLDDAVLELDASKGLVAASEAIVEAAKIRLGYTEIHSPITGLIGVSEAYAGDYVGRYPAPAVLTTVSRLDPIKVRFSISERDYLRAVRNKGPKKREQMPALELFLADGSKFPHMGTVEFAGREIDAKTGTLMLEAHFPNPDQVLRPGQFARIRAAARVKKAAVLVPQKAVKEMQGLYSVLRVQADGTVEEVRVEVGVRVGPLWQIDKGLAAGDRIVVGGLHLARPGSKITPVTPDSAAQAPAPKKDPK